MNWGQVRLFGLPWTVTEATLRRWVREAVGAEPASTAMHVFAESLRFAGDGFVTMATNAAAVALVSGFHGLLGGRAVSCHPALEADLQTVLRLPFPGNGPLGAIRIENMYWHSKLDEISTWCQQHAGGQAPVGVLGLGCDTILVAFFFFFFFGGYAPT